MRNLNKPSSWVCFLALAGGLVGCLPTKPQSFRNSFLPPAPKPPAWKYVAPEPPVVEPAVPLESAPKFLDGPSQEAIRAGRMQALIREAEGHYQAGRKHYQEGNLESARREFDYAVDLLLSAPEGADAWASLEKKLAELVEAIHRYDLAGLGAGDVLAEPGFEKPPLEDIPQMTFPIDPKIKNKVIEEVRATVSQLPLQVNDAVLSYLHYFSSERGRKMVAFGLRRAGRYRPLVRRILDEEGVPQELMFLAQAESGFQPRAVSRKKATGMWQFVRGRGREYGLTQTLYSDDRLDPEKATRAAARHLRDLYHHFGDWYLAMAAYNAGPGVIDKAVERTGYADFWELRRRNVLPKETANYVPIILAMTIMVKNAREYGLDALEADPPLEYDTLEMAAPTHLLLVSDLTECPISQLRELNPALLNNVAPAGYLLRTRKGTAGALLSALETVPPNRRASWRVHRVGDGETLAAIAQRYRMPKAAILAANQTLASAPETGDLVLIPAAAQEQKAAAKPGLARRPARKSASRKSTPGRRASS